MQSILDVNEMVQHRCTRSVRIAATVTTLCNLLNKPNTDQQTRSAAQNKNCHLDVPVRQRFGRKAQIWNVKTDLLLFGILKDLHAGMKILQLWHYICLVLKTSGALADAHLMRCEGEEGVWEQLHTEGWIWFAMVPSKGLKLIFAVALEQMWLGTEVFQKTVKSNIIKAPISLSWLK